MCLPNAQSRGDVVEVVLERETDPSDVEERR